MGGTPGGLVRGAQHLGTTRGVDRDHPDLQVCRGLDRGGDDAWNVVKLQVEEHPIASIYQRLDHRRAFGGEEPAPDLEAAGCAA